MIIFLCTRGYMISRLVILIVRSFGSSDLLSQIRAKTLLAIQSNNSGSCITSNLMALLAYLPV